MNPYRELFTATLKIMRKSAPAETKLAEFKQLHQKLKKKLVETEHLLNASPAFADRCEHWNQVQLDSIKRVTNIKNPWLSFKRQFEQAIKMPAEAAEVAISKELAWFMATPHTKDWIRE